MSSSFIVQLTRGNPSIDLRRLKVSRNGGRDGENFWELHKVVVIFKFSVVSNSRSSDCEADALPIEPKV